MLTKADLHVCPDTNEAYLSMVRTGIINRKRLLRLTLRRKPFLEILMGKKKEEYREYTPYWMERLGDKDGQFNEYDSVEFRNGYRRDSPRIILDFKAVRVDTLPDGTKRYAVELGQVRMSNMFSAPHHCTPSKCGGKQ